MTVLKLIVAIPALLVILFMAGAVIGFLGVGVYILLEIVKAFATV